MSASENPGFPKNPGFTKKIHHIIGPTNLDFLLIFVFSETRLVADVKNGIYDDNLTHHFAFFFSNFVFTHSSFVVFL